MDSNKMDSSVADGSNAVADSSRQADGLTNSMKVLFVASGNKAVGKCSSFVQSQFDSLVNAGLEMELYPVVGHGSNAFLRHLRALRQLIKTWKPDIVHAHYSTFGVLAFLATIGLRHKPKMVVSILGSFPSHSIKWRYVRFFVKHIWDKTITKSKRTAEQLGFDLPVIPNGVNTDIFHPMDQKEAREIFLQSQITNHQYIIWCSNPERVEKNWPLAQRAVELLQSQISNHKSPITNHKSPIKNQKSSITNQNSPITNHQSQIHLVAVYNKTPQEVATYMNAADVMLLTSMSEGSPNVIKEALACNCPIVTTDVGDVHERLDGVEGCYIIPTDGTETYGLQGCGEWFEKDAIQLAGCLAQALDFGKRTNGYDRIIADHITTSDIASKILNIYQS